MPNLARFGRLPIAPFALPIMVGVDLWSENRGRLGYEATLPAIAGMLVITSMLLGIARLSVGNWARASLIALVWTGFLLYTPALTDLFTTNRTLELAAFAAGALLAWDISRRIPTDRAAATRANALANLAVWFPALVVGSTLAVSQVRLEQGRPDPRETFATLPGKANAGSPDVWHIVMDRYAGQTTLMRDFGFDNSAFLDGLRSRGFAVADDAYANYQSTPLSLASTLNVSYLDGYTARLGQHADLVPMFRAIDRNVVFDFFRRQHYEIIHMGGWADVTRRNSQADRTITFRPVSEASRILLGRSVPGVVGEALGLPYLDNRRDQCLRSAYKFRKLREIAGETGRKFVFAHFLVPHPPFTVKANGECQTIKEARRIGRDRSYTGQIEFANRELLRLIDAIMAGPRPATIVLHADEGPYPAQFDYSAPEFKPVNPKGDDLFTVSADVRRHKTGIILALRQADGSTGPAPRSPINIYPTILNRSFGARIPPREDKTFMYPRIPDYAKLKDVSNETFGYSDGKP